MKELINVALDLETLSTREDAAIIQIGCAIPAFDMVHLPPHLHTFEATIRYEDCLSSEFHKDKSTMEWWEKQDPKTKAIVFSGQSTYVEAFDSFSVWIRTITDHTGGDVAIWGNGSDFDNRLLSYSLDALGYHDVWSFRNNRDLRTLKSLFPVTVPEYPSEIKHTALGDARYEARVIQQVRDVYYQPMFRL